MCIFIYILKQFPLERGIELLSLLLSAWGFGPAAEVTQLCQSLRGNGCQTTQNVWAETKTTSFSFAAWTGEQLAADHGIQITQHIHTMGKAECISYDEHKLPYIDLGSAQIRMEKEQAPEWALKKAQDELREVPGVKEQAIKELRELIQSGWKHMHGG